MGDTFYGSEGVFFGGWGGGGSGVLFLKNCAYDLSIADLVDTFNM